MKRLPAILASVAVVLGLVACHPEPTNDTQTRPSWPQDETTGPEVSGLNEDALPSCGNDGAWDIDTPNVTVADCHHNGLIRVNASGVTLRNVTVAGDTTGPVVRNNSGHLQIERSIIYNARPASAQPCAASVAYGNYTLVQSEVYGCADGLKLSGSVEVVQSFIHNLTRWCNPTTGSCTHNDGLQSNDQAGRLDTIHVTITDSSVYMYSCISNAIIQAPNLTNSTFDLQGNFFYGSHGLMKVGKEALETNTGVVTDNVFAGAVDVGPFNAREDGSANSPGLFNGPGISGIDFSGNVFEDGNPVPVSGKMSPYRCEAS